MSQKVKWKYELNKNNNLYYCLHKNKKGLWEIAYKTESELDAKLYVDEMISVDNDLSYLNVEIYF